MRTKKGLDRMFNRKTEEPENDQTESEKDPQMENEEQHEDGAAPVQMKPQLRAAQGSGRTGNPEIVRRAPEIPSVAGRRGAAEREQSTDSKKLIVGREIVLSGEINSCDRLVVEGRVEANIADCREIEIAESGTFKGEAEIDFADISGNFEGSLTARSLLLVRATGRVTGNVRFGQLEIERGGQIVGDVRTCGSEAGAVTARETAAE